MEFVYSRMGKHLHNDLVKKSGKADVVLVIPVALLLFLAILIFVYIDK